MDFNDVKVLLALFFFFLQKNGGQGCHAGQDLWKVYGRGIILVKKVHLAETEDVLSRRVWRWFPMSVLFTRYPKDAY